MARKTHKPLTTRDAKAQLRDVATHTGVSHWVRTHPYEAMSLGLATGMVLGAKGRRPPLALVALAGRLLNVLF